jgi:hypothetical protein
LDGDSAKRKVVEEFNFVLLFLSFLEVILLINYVLLLTGVILELGIRARKKA